MTAPVPHAWVVPWDEWWQAADEKIREREPHKLQVCLFQECDEYHSKFSEVRRRLGDE